MLRMGYPTLALFIMPQFHMTCLETAVPILVKNRFMDYNK